MTRHKVKITVLKAVKPETLYEEVPLNSETGKPHVKCPIHEEGQEYIITHNYAKPEDFCPGAWHDIRETVSVLHLGGTFYPWLGENEMIKCCTDGLRPVIFRIERLEPIE
ncbi:TIGR04076 family protein [Candidatus Bathyarchaeota archaeon]|nr:TIGR04076 family protein [Candidatus Bathyarchaeota archaeon]